MLDQPSHRSLKLYADFTFSARTADLRYVTDVRPGITRKREKGGPFCYFTASGRRIRDRRMLERIKRLAIPPAWRDVWVCPDATGHLQATGRDARGRKQYRYHPDWRKIRDEKKYDRVIAFGRALPKMRRRVARYLTRRGLTRDKVLATIVRLLETTLIRVANDEYARATSHMDLPPFGIAMPKFAPALSRSSFVESRANNMFLMCAAEDSQGS